MKAIGIILLYLLTSLAVVAQQHYQINGKIAGLAEGSKVYLIRGFKRIDSASVHKQQFTMHGSLREPAFTSLYTESGRDAQKLADLLLDNRRILLTGTQSDYEQVNVSGSDLDQSWKEWFSKDQRMAYQGYRLEEVSKALIEKGDQTNAKVLRKVSQEMITDRILLLKAYVKQYHDSAVGAVLPTLCTLHAQLSQADFMEMYNVLSPEMKKTEMAKETLQLAQKAKVNSK